MGANSLGHGQSFVSDNRQIKRCINQAVKSAKSDPDKMKNVTSLISKAFEIDKKIHQNLVLTVEKLVIDGRLDAATTFANSCIRVISTSNKK